MGPTSLSAPLSPAPFPAEFGLPYPCLNAMPGRSDAHRIGPIGRRVEPISDCVTSCGAPFRSGLATISIRKPLHANLRRRLVPSGGRFGSEELLLPPGGSKGVSLLHHWTTYPCGLPFHWLPSGVFVPPFAGLATRSGLSLHTFRPTWSLPIAARLSRHLRFARLTPKGCHARFPTLLRASLPSRSG